jgi:hypothetical protein
MKLELVTAELMREAWLKIGGGPGAQASGWYQLLADALNAALASLIAEQKAAILKLAADTLKASVQAHQRGERTVTLQDALDEIAALSPADALAKHDAGVRRKEAEWWEGWKDLLLRHTRECSFDSNDSPEGDFCTCGLSTRRKMINERLATLEAGRTP